MQSRTVNLSSYYAKPKRATVIESEQGQFIALAYILNFNTDIVAKLNAILNVEHAVYRGIILYFNLAIEQTAAFGDFLKAKLPVILNKYQFVDLKIECNRIHDDIKFMIDSPALESFIDDVLKEIRPYCANDFCKRSHPLKIALPNANEITYAVASDAADLTFNARQSLVHSIELIHVNADKVSVSITREDLEKLSLPQNTTSLLSSSVFNRHHANETTPLLKNDSNENNPTCSFCVIN